VADEFAGPPNEPFHVGRVGVPAIVLTAGKLPIGKALIHGRHFGGPVIAFDIRTFGPQQVIDAPRIDGGHEASLMVEMTEADRQVLNQWIRTSGHFDAVIDFDSVVRDPKHPDQLLPAYDCGDNLHPSPSGYKAMGDAVPLTLFAR
jgi:hypothetical protein